jgi:hypothetical protein
MESEIVLKLTPPDYQRLRNQIDSGSPAHDAINKATPIDHALDGVQFAGYTIPCTEEQASAILKTAKQCCPGAVSEIERAIELARGDQRR